eukprot:scaffold683_cov124-Cylindrotheca_fusiformis.AAC.4
MDHASFGVENESEFGSGVCATKRLQVAHSPLRNKKPRVSDVLDENQQGPPFGEPRPSLQMDSFAATAAVFPPLPDQMLDIGVQTTAMTHTTVPQQLFTTGNFSFQPIENQTSGDGTQQIRYRHLKDASHLDTSCFDSLLPDQSNSRTAPLDATTNVNDQGFSDPFEFQQKYSIHSLPSNPQFHHGAQWNSPALQLAPISLPLPESTLAPVQFGPGAQSQMLIPQIARFASDQTSLLPGRISGYQTSSMSRSISPGIPGRSSGYLPALQPRSISLGIPLSLSCDGDELSEYQMLIRQQLEIFEASPEDVSSNTQGRKKQIKLGQAGIRCKHCSRFPLRQRGKGAVYYPTKLQGRKRVSISGK